MAHKHSVYDTDKHFIINPITRVAKTDPSHKTMVIQFDHNSERFTFELPRYIEGHDMTECNKVEVHYLNVDTKTKEERRGVYISDDLKVSADDPNVVVCSWLISGNATELVGTLSFVVRYCCVEGDVVTYAWNTAVATVNVSTGINGSDVVVAEYADVLEKWKAELFNAGYINADTMKQNISDLSNALNVERKRIDNIVALPNGSTTGDAELMDIRVGADGKTYDSAGTAVRGQISGITNGVTIKGNAITPHHVSFASVNPNNLFNIEEAEIRPGYYNATDTYASPELFKTVFFKVEPNTLYYTNFVPTQSLNLTFYGANRNVVQHLNTGTYAPGTIPACDSEFVVEVGMAVNNNFSIDELVVSKAPIAENADKSYFYEMPKFRANYKNIENIVGLVPGRNLFNKDAVKVGYEVYADGTIKAQANSAISDYCIIPSNAKVLYLSGLPTYEGGELASRFSYFYDEEKKPIGNYPRYIARDTGADAINIPIGAKYFVFSVYQRYPEYAFLDYSNVMITSINGASFEPYKDAIGSIGGKELTVCNRTENTWATGKTLLIFGDSITETAKVSDDGTEYTEGVRTNWPEFAKDTIGVEKMWNFAKSGGHLKDDAGLEHRQWVSNQIKAAINNVESADIVVLSAGTNDSNGNVGTYEDAMAAKTLGELDRTKLYSAIRWAMWTIRTTYPQAVCFAATPIQRADRETDAAVVNAIVEMAKRYNFIVIDANAECGIVRENEVWQAEGQYLSDGLHPNKKGSERMAAYYSAKIMHHISTM